MIIHLKDFSDSIFEFSILQKLLLKNQPKITLYSCNNYWVAIFKAPKNGRQQKLRQQ